MLLNRISFSPAPVCPWKQKNYRRKTFVSLLEARHANLGMCSQICSALPALLGLATLRRSADLQVIKHQHRQFNDALQLRVVGEEGITAICDGHCQLQGMWQRQVVIRA